MTGDACSDDITRDRLDSDHLLELGSRSVNSDASSTLNQFTVCAGGQIFDRFQHKRLIYAKDPLGTP